MQEEDASMPDLNCYFPGQGPCSLVAMPYAQATCIQLLQCMARSVMGTEASCYPS